MTCPFCLGARVYCEFVDIGVGYQQVTPYDCGDCGAQQMSPYGDNSRATARERWFGWWMGQEEYRRNARFDKRERLAARLAEIRKRTRTLSKETRS